MMTVDKKLEPPRQQIHLIRKEPLAALMNNNVENVIPPQAT